MIKIGGRGAKSSSGRAIGMTAEQVIKRLNEKIDNLEFNNYKGAGAGKWAHAVDQRDKFNIVRENIEENKNITNAKYNIDKDGNIEVEYKLHWASGKEKYISPTLAVIDTKGNVSYPKKGKHVQGKGI